MFYCRAIQGESDYNICINSDLTVSCNCQDYDGLGQIGDLRESTFEEIFRGSKAQAFREALLRGKHPVPICKSCSELRTATEPPERYLSGFRLPFHGIMVENTCLCNLNCVGCKRERTMRRRKQHRMNIDDVRTVAGILKGLSVRWLHYFNLGEPFLSPTILEELMIIREFNPDLPKIAVSTNGTLLDSSGKVEAALMIDHIYFSIDGTDQDAVEKYQRGADFDRSYGNMKALVEERNRKGRETPVIEWKYVVFNHNDELHYIERAIQLAREARVDVLSFWQGGGVPEMFSANFSESVYFKAFGRPSWKGREIDFRFKPKVRRLFKLFLDRNPEPAVLESASEVLRMGHLTIEQYALSLIQSEEFKTKVSTGYCYGVR